MFRGTVIEELINSVCRAEEHARQQELQDIATPELWQQQPQYQEFIEVA